MITLAEAQELLGQELELVLDDESLFCVVAFLFEDDRGRVYAAVAPEGSLDSTEDEPGEMIVLEVTKDHGNLCVAEVPEEDVPHVVDFLARAVKRIWPHARTIGTDVTGVIDLSAYELN